MLFVGKYYHLFEISLLSAGERERKRGGKRGGERGRNTVRERSGAAILVRKGGPYLLSVKRKFMFTVRPPPPQIDS